MATGIKIDEETKERLRCLGEKIDRSPHWIMKQAIETYLSNQEQYWKEREEDMQRWEEYMLTGDNVPHEAVMEWLDKVGTDAAIECPA